MPSVIDSHRNELAVLCRKYAVRRLELFGSATTSEFDPDRSDLDFIVEFEVDPTQDLFHRYFGLNEALAKLFGRKVDLVMVDAIKNPYFIQAVNKTRQLVYAA